MANAQKINSENTTYFRVDYSEVPSLMDLEDDKFPVSSYANDKPEDSKDLSVTLKDEWVKDLEFDGDYLFIIDTANRDDRGNFSFYSHPDFFDSLQHQKATFINETRKVGVLAESVVINQKTTPAIAKILMKMGVIETYYHLYAELIIDKIKESDDEITVFYNCIFHYCTNKCYDPEYDFSFTINKSNRTVSIGK